MLASPFCSLTLSRASVDSVIANSYLLVIYSISRLQLELNDRGCTVRMYVCV